MSNDLVLSGAVWSSLSPKFGAQFLVGGTGEVSGVMPSNSVFTVEAWLLLQSVPAVAAALGAQGWFWIGAIGSDLIAGTAPSSDTGTGGILAGSGWTHVALVVDATAGSATLYQNGSAVAVLPAPDPGARPAGASVLTVGQYIDGAFAPVWPYGGIQEVALFGYARYTADFPPPTSPYTGKESGLLGLWHLDGDGLDYTTPVVSIREQVAEALISKFQGAVAIASGPAQPMFRTVTRRMTMFDQVDSPEQPSVSVFEIGEEYGWQSTGTPSRRLLQFVAVCSARTTPDSPGGTVVNDMVTVIEGLFTPDNLSANVCTLGGLAYRCWIDGRVVKDAGDLDGQALVVVPITVMLP